MDRGVREYQVPLSAHRFDGALLEDQSRTRNLLGTLQHFRGVVQPNHCAAGQRTGQLRGQFAGSAPQVYDLQALADLYEGHEVFKRGETLASEFVVAIWVPGHDLLSSLAE